MRRLLVIAAVLSLCACTTTQITTSHQTAEKAEITCELAYQGIASAINGAEATGILSGAKATAADAVKVQAWQALQIARQAYTAGLVIDTSALASLVTQTNNLVGGK